MNSNINNSIFEAYVKSKTPIVENKQESQQVIEESKKPDFLDIDKDGDKKESMKKAASDAGKKKGGKKGMSAKQAKFFGKKKKKAVKENVNLNADQNVLKENFRAILQKNGLSDLVTPKIIKAMLEAFALGKSVNESTDEKTKLKAEHDEIKKSLAKAKNEGHDNSRMIKRMQEIKNKLKGLSGYMSKGD
jgi:hypothetical protein